MIKYKKYIVLYEHFDREFYPMFNIFGNLDSVFISIPYESGLTNYRKCDYLIVPYYSQINSLLYDSFSYKILINFNFEQLLGNFNSQTKKLYPKSNHFNIYWNSDFEKHLDDWNIVNRIKITNPLHLKQENLFDFVGFSKEYDRNKVIFCPDSFSWAFITKKMYRNKIKQGFDKSVIDRFVKFSKINLDLFLNKLKTLANKNPNLLFVIRPHPTVTESRYRKYVRDILGPLPSNIVITHSYSAYHFLNISCGVISGWSTLMSDAYLFGLSSYSTINLEYEIPDDIKVPWFIKVINYSKTLSLDDFISQSVMMESTSNPLKAELNSKLIDLIESSTYSHDYTIPNRRFRHILRNIKYHLFFKLKVENPYLRDKQII